MAFWLKIAVFSPIFLINKGMFSLQSPIFGYLWGYPILWISEPWKYPIPEWYDLHTIPSYHGMGATYHSTWYHTIPYHSIPPHTIPSHLIPYHSTSYHTIPYHTIIPNLSQGGWDPFYKIWKLFLQAAVLAHWAPSFVDRFFRFLLSFSDTTGGYMMNVILLNQLDWALSQVVALTLKIIHHKPLKLYILEGCLIDTIFVTNKSMVHPPQWYGLWEANKTRHLCIGCQSWTMHDFIHWKGGKFSPITAQGKHAFFK